MAEVTVKPIDGNVYWLAIDRIPRGTHDGDTVRVDLLIKRYDADADEFVYTRQYDCVGSWDYRKRRYERRDLPESTRAVAFAQLPPTSAASISADVP